ncbi:MAG: M20/M25/M40 family metallo-hydrolase [Prevotellaceae bacterium]|nr:M20/M25/M40 family metallo-hydrolase [Prevotellaceae bacterium]
MRSLGLSPYEDNTASVTGSNTGNIICKVNGGGNFVLVAHMDTIYSTKGVKPVLLDDRITSDDTTILGADNRLGIAVILYAIKNAIEQNIPIRPFTIAFTTCEETTLLGSKNIELDKAIASGFVFDSPLVPGHFVDQGVGVIGFEVKIKGRAGFISNSSANATQIAVEAFSNYPFGNTATNVIANIGFTDGENAVNAASNFIMPHGELQSFSRTLVEEHAERIKQIFAKAAEKYGGAVEYDAAWKFKPYHLVVTTEPYKRILDIFKSLRLKPKASISQGGCDANLLNERGIRTINLGVGIHKQHTNEEFVLLKDLENAIEITYRLIKF